MAEVEKEVVLEEKKEEETLEKKEEKPTNQEVENLDNEDNENDNTEAEKKKKKKKKSKKKAVTGIHFFILFNDIGSILPEGRLLGGYVDWYVKSGQTADLQTPVMLEIQSN